MRVAKSQLHLLYHSGYGKRGEQIVVAATHVIAFLPVLEILEGDVLITQTGSDIPYTEALGELHESGNIALVDTRVGTCKLGSVCCIVSGKPRRCVFIAKLYAALPYGIAEHELFGKQAAVVQGGGSHTRIIKVTACLVIQQVGVILLPHIVHVEIDAKFSDGAVIIHIGVVFRRYITLLMYIDR